MSEIKSRNNEELSQTCIKSNLFVNHRTKNFSANKIKVLSVDYEELISYARENNKNMRA